MTIAELFVKLGFISETADLDKVQKQLDLSYASAKKLAIGLGMIDTALIALMKVTINAAVGFSKFRTETGLSTDELQRWQYAARLANVDSKDLTSAVMSIQDAQAAISLGEGNIAPWQLLGIDPRQNPFDVLTELSKKIQGLAPGVGRHITSQMGINDDVYQLLDLLGKGKISLSDFKKEMAFTATQEADMMALNKQWKIFTAKLDSTAMKVGHDLKPAFDQLLPLIVKFLDKAAAFADWLSGGTTGSKVFREGLVLVAEGAMIAGPALAALLSIMGAFKTITMSADVLRMFRLLGDKGKLPELSKAGGNAELAELDAKLAAGAGETVSGGASLGAWAVLAAGIAGLAIVTYDVYKAIKNPADPKKVEQEKKAMEDQGLLPTHRKSVRELMDSWDHPSSNPLPQIVAPTSSGSGDSSPATPTVIKTGDTTHNVTVNVDATGAKDPQAVGDAVGSSIEDAIDAYKKREYAAAAAQAAVPNTGY